MCTVDIMQRTAVFLLASRLPIQSAFLRVTLGFEGQRLTLSLPLTALKKYNFGPLPVLFIEQYSRQRAAYKRPKHDLF